MSKISKALIIVIISLTFTYTDVRSVEVCDKVHVSNDIEMVNLLECYLEQFTYMRELSDSLAAEVVKLKEKLNGSTKKSGKKSGR